MCHPVERGVTQWRNLAASVSELRSVQDGFTTGRIQVGIHLDDRPVIPKGVGAIRSIWGLEIEARGSIWLHDGLGFRPAPIAIVIPEHSEETRIVPLIAVEQWVSRRLLRRDCKSRGVLVVWFGTKIIVLIDINLHPFHRQFRMIHSLGESTFKSGFYHDGNGGFVDTYETWNGTDSLEVGNDFIRDRTAFFGLCRDGKCRKGEQRVLGWADWWDGRQMADQLNLNAVCLGLAVM